MSAARRGLLLSFTFLGLVLWLSPGRRAHAQPPGRMQPVAPAIQPNDPGPGRHTIWQSHLSPEEIRRLLAGYVEGDNGTNDLLEKLIQQALEKQNPKADPKQREAAVKRLLEDKELMNRLMDVAQKRKNQLPPGEQPKLTPEDIARIVKAHPNAGNGRDPFKLPDEPFPNWDPNKGPKIDPKLFPRDPNTGFPLDPRTNQPFDPNTGFPLDPNTGKPFDPMTGKPIDPKDPPRFNPNPPQPPVQPKGMPPEPPKIDPKTGQPVDPMNGEPKRTFDPDNPLGAPKQTPEQAAKTKAVEAATALWEKNVGPIDESPAVKRALVDLVSDSDAFDALTDDKGNSIFEMLQKDAGDGETFGDWLKGDDSKWDWPKMDWKLDWGRSDRDIDLGDRNRSSRSRWDMPDRSPRRGGSTSGLDGLGSFNFGSVQVPWLLVLILLAAVVAAVVLWKWKAIFSPQPATAFAADGLGPWPLDPREINTREDVVKAFEYLSVLICGPAARTWTHSTIADELSALAETHGETAVKLARLYELARYAPLDEPLTRAELLEARRLACDLAGVDEA